MQDPFMTARAISRLNPLTIFLFQPTVPEMEALPPRHLAINLSTHVAVGLEQCRSKRRRLVWTRKPTTTSQKSGQILSMWLLRR